MQEHFRSVSQSKLQARRSRLNPQTQHRPEPSPPGARRPRLYIHRAPCVELAAQTTHPLKQSRTTSSIDREPFFSFVSTLAVARAASVATDPALRSCAPRASAAIDEEQEVEHVGVEVAPG